MIHRLVPHCDGILNFDEMPLSCSGVMGKSKTLAFMTDDLVVVNSDANDTKRFGTLIPVVCARKMNGDWEGINLATFIIYIGDPKQDRVLNEAYYPGVNILWTKCGVMTSELMINQVIPIIRARLDALGMGRVVTVLDSARSHTSETVIETLWSKLLPAVVVPAGLTSFVQWVDVNFAKDNRKLHVELYEEWSQVKKTAAQKRRLISCIAGQCCQMMVVSQMVVKTFKNLRYIPTNPPPAIPTLPGLRPTIITHNEYINDREVLIARMKSSAESTIAQPTSKPSTAPKVNKREEKTEKKGRKPTCATHGPPKINAPTLVSMFSKIATEKRIRDETPIGTEVMEIMRGERDTCTVRAPIGFSFFKLASPKEAAAPSLMSNLEVDGARVLSQLRAEDSDCDNSNTEGMY